jgi:hypothetical protein
MISYEKMNCFYRRTNAPETVIILHLWMEAFAPDKTYGGYSQDRQYPGE